MEAHGTVSVFPGKAPFSTGEKMHETKRYWFQALQSERFGEDVATEDFMSAGLNFLLRGVGC